MQHGSFFSGSNLKSAGYLEVDENGKIKAIWNKSDHYRPRSNEMDEMVHYLRQEHYDLSKTTITVNKHSHPWMICLSDFLKNHFNIRWKIRSLSV